MTLFLENGLPTVPLLLVKVSLVNLPAAVPVQLSRKLGTASAVLMTAESPRARAAPEEQETVEPYSLRMVQEELTVRYEAPFSSGRSQACAVACMAVAGSTI